MHPNVVCRGTSTTQPTTTGRTEAIGVTGDGTGFTVTTREGEHDSQHAMLATDAMVCAEKGKTIISVGDTITAVQNVLTKGGSWTLLRLRYAGGDTVT